MLHWKERIFRLFLEFNRTKRHPFVAYILQVMECKLSLGNIVEMRLTVRGFTLIGSSIVGALQEVTAFNSGPEIRADMAKNRHPLAWFQCHLPNTNAVVFKHEILANGPIHFVILELLLDFIRPIFKIFGGQRARSECVGAAFWIFGLCVLLIVLVVFDVDSRVSPARTEK